MKDQLSASRWDAVVQEMRHLLIQCARNQQTVTYSELSRMIQTEHIHYHSRLLVRLLDQLGNEEEAEGHPCLPALVVTKQTGMPGGGFFTGLAHEFSQDPDALEAYWRAKVKEVFDYWAQ